MIKKVEPKVYLVGHQTLDSVRLGEFLEEEFPDNDKRDVWIGADGDAELLCEAAGRLCYMSFTAPRPGGNKAYLQRILESAHGSVLEHAVWNFIVTGISRSLSHELVRHRAGWAYSQLSQRYVDESVAEYVEPEIIAEDPELDEYWTQAIVYAHNAYVGLATKLYEKVVEREYEKRGPDHMGRSPEEWLKLMPADFRTGLRKAARQAARSVLPNATETKIFLTVNARAARHFIELRSNKAAEPEIRRLANLLYQELVMAAPNIFGDYEPDGEKQPYELLTDHRKV